jgi:hypothetical protein
MPVKISFPLTLLSLLFDFFKIIKLAVLIDTALKRAVKPEDHEEILHGLFLWLNLFTIP